MLRKIFKNRTFYLIGLLLLIVATPFSLLVTEQKSNENIHASTANTQATDPVIVAAGDIACPSGQSVSSTQCQQLATANLVQSLNPVAVLTLGDEQYEDGTYAQFMGAGAYNDTWGQFKSITKPVPGNHEYHTSGASGYFDYFNGVGVQTGIAGDRSKGYYSYDIGSWHFIALNSEQDTNAGGAQEVWLKQDLASHASAQCTAAYWHQPEFSSGYHPSNTYFKAFWDDLYAAKADLILNGHSHDYERFTAQNPNGNADPTNGIIEIGSGMGGDAPEAATGTKPNSVIFQNTVFGVVKLTLHPGSYDFTFVPISGQSFNDSGNNISCHKASTLPGVSSTPQPVTPAPTGISPTFVCIGGVPCTSPNASPTVTPSTSPSVIPSTQLSPNPSVTQPCTINASASTQDSHGKKHQKGQSGSGGISGFLSQLINFLLQLFALLFQLFGGTLPSPLPTPTPSIVPTGDVSPTGSQTPTDTQTPANPCPSDTPSSTIPSVTLAPSSQPSVSPNPTSSTVIGPVTSNHFTANSNFTNGVYTPGAVGFNIADVSSVSEVTSLPAGVKGLVDVNMCQGADSTFIAKVQPFIGNAKVYGFYLIDEPDPTGQYKALCSPANLKAEATWIHTNMPSAKTFIVLMNMASSKTPTYQNTYNPSNSGVDLYGIDAYPCRTDYNGCDYSIITRNITSVQAAGVPLADVVPVYQTFGGGSWVDDGGGAYTMPTATEATQMLTTWATVVPNPQMDYAYSWGIQNGDQALSGSPALQQIFAAHNK